VNLILLEPHELGGAGLVHLTGPRALHVIHVLKAAPGARIRIGVLDGPAGEGAIDAITGETVALRCALENHPPPAPRVDVLLAVPRPKILRRLWAQLAAIGVGQIVLTNASRVERNYFDTHVLTDASYRPLLIEGLQQARDTRLPKVTIRRQLKILIEDELDVLFPQGARVVADPSAAKPLVSVVRESAAERVLLAVGPEGGWTPYELDLLGAHGFQAAGLGPRTLRTDTACVALLTLVHDALRRPAQG
jgi:RsmE family RNA methyltransferase